MGSPYFASIGYASPLTLHIPPDLPGCRATRLHQDNQRLAELPSCVTPSLAYYQVGSHAPPHTNPKVSSGFGWLASPASARARYHEHGNINPLSIDYACRPRLRSRLTLGGKPGPGTLGHSAAEILTLHSLLMPAFSLAHPPPPVTPRLHGCTTLPYPTPHIHTDCHGFGGTLEPRYIVGAGPLDQ